MDRAVRVDGAAPFLQRLHACFEGRTSAVDDSADWDLEVELHPAPGTEEPSGDCMLEIRTRPGDAMPDFPFIHSRAPFLLTGALGRWAIRSTRRHYVFHAGCVSRDGRAALLPASSFGGKSTLTTALVRRGFLHLSDEMAALDLETGCVVPFPRALSLRCDVLDVLGLPADVGFPSYGGEERIVAVAEAGGERATAPARPALVLFPHYRIGAATDLRTATAGEAVLALMESSCSQPGFGERGLDIVLDLVRRVRRMRLTYSSLAEAVALVEDLFLERATR